MIKKNHVIELTKVEIDIGPRDSVNLLGDIHSGANSEFETEIFKRHIKHLSHDPKRRVFWGGDLLDIQQFSKLPTIKPKNIEEDIYNFLTLTEPIHEQTEGITWGNHEERLFRDPVGRSTMPNLLYGHLSIVEEMKEKNPDLICTDLQRSLYATLNVKGGNPVNLLIKHGYRWGRQGQVKEHDEIMRVLHDVDVISLHHTHSPYWFITSKMDMDGNVSPVNIFRGSAYVSWLPYQEKKNFPPALMGYWELKIRKDGKIKPKFVSG